MLNILEDIQLQSLQNINRTPVSVFSNLNIYELRFTESTLVPTIALAMGSVQRVSPFQVKFTVNVINTGRARPATFPTVKPIAAVLTTATVTSQGKNCVSAMIVGKVSLYGVMDLETGSYV